MDSVVTIAANWRGWRNVASFISPEWSEHYLEAVRDRTITQPQQLLQTLYIGESSEGLYALNAFVDQQTDVYALRSVGPLLEGPKDEKAKGIQRSDNLDGPTYRTTDGEFLILGHHEVPPLLLKNLITTDSDHNRLPWITYVKGREEIKERIGGSGAVTPNYSNTLALGHNEEDFDWSHLFQQAWKKNPYVVTLFLGGIVMILLYAAFLYGQQRITNQILSSRGEIHSGGSSTRNTLSAPGALDEEGSGSGPKEIGKLSFDSRKILGMGCAGTTVFKGTFDGREVAVKRVLTSQYKLVERELELLRKSDAHKNVIRYFCSERDDNFHYIALELCECTLSDYVKLRDRRQKYSSDVLDILKQATEGVAHLHSISIVHRDLKPQNILLSTLNSKGHVRVKISDFGLCKQVKLGHASISKVSGLVGTEGWIAPEAINQNNSSVTYSVDVFSLGCIFYYVLSEGKHPFGERNDVRHANIYSGKFNLEHLVGKEDYVSMNAIEKMVEMDPKKRPTSHAVLCHPVFWSKERQLRFFSDVSDRIEKEDETSEIVRCLELNSYQVVSSNWSAKLSFSVQQDLRNHRSYKGHSIKDLLRAIRNKKNHYQELPIEVRQEYGSIPDEYMTYFTTRFPHLLIHVFKVMALCADESAFVSYYPLESRSFCGRVLQEQLLDEFCIQGSPKRTILSKTMVPPSVSTTASPSNWRTPEPQMKPQPGFKAFPASTVNPSVTSTPEGKTRRRRRKKPTLMALASTLEGDLDDAGDADMLDD
ncbi:unnamed protein product [Bursaphelenchus xylophilus]|uniref:non-specific serine/threonine protein kinase n=1 Tax=Bursaphelenchus xylophilus TaxID=6326 RepID=A0A1I7SSC7_BURXY|nr:unnamed protein product [Bursaphelenchus xylophilus]CAG9097723.1 unnamed protein product [Bursaphelenchus xylophilus]